MPAKGIEAEAPVAVTVMTAMHSVRKAEFRVVIFMGGKTKSTKGGATVNGVIFSVLQSVLRAVFYTLKT